MNYLIFFFFLHAHMYSICVIEMETGEFEMAYSKTIPSANYIIYTHIEMKWSQYMLGKLPIVRQLSVCVQVHVSAGQM